MSPPTVNLQGADQTTRHTYLEATRLLLDELDRRLHEAGIFLADHGLLSRRSTADEWGMRMGELAEGTVSSRSLISHGVDRLERMGWVERRACPTDRRGSYASLTEAGRRKLAEAEPGQAEVVRRHLLDHLEIGDGQFGSVMAAARDSLQTGSSRD
ncbi:MAG TPA: MarR family transcriptional regulator [Acidimicrobiia bacterium]|nr:MarR family transcriptional regulator [Acidimicrobiia bacterium]